MNDISIPASINTPMIDFKTSGSIVIRGKSLPENAAKFYQPLIMWVKELNTDAVEAEINLEYINSSSAKKLLEMLRAVDKNQSVKKITVNWFYDEDDEDAVENGRIFCDLVKRATFRYHSNKGKDQSL